MTSPTDSSCTYTDAANLNKLVDSMHKCMNDPTATDCATDYGAATTLPKVHNFHLSFLQYYLFQVLLAKCDETTCTTLTTDVTALKGCMTSPTDPSCTGTYSDATTLNKLVDTMHKCMNDPTATDCTTPYSATTTLPKVSQQISDLTV